MEPCTSHRTCSYRHKHTQPPCYSFYIFRGKKQEDLNSKAMCAFLGDLSTRGAVQVQGQYTGSSECGAALQPIGFPFRKIRV